MLGLCLWLSRLSDPVTSIEHVASQDRPVSGSSGGGVHAAHSAVHATSHGAVHPRFTFGDWNEWASRGREVLAELVCGPQDWTSAMQVE
jgi:3-mercaptopyruvate sulfurtransferase SseA